MATTTRSRAAPRPYGSPPAQPGICIPTDAEVAAVGHPWALWATIDVTSASDGEVRYGLVCSGVSGGTGYGLAVTINAPPTTTIGWQAVSGGSQAGTPVTVYGIAMRQVGPRLAARWLALQPVRRLVEHPGVDRPDYS